LAAERDLRALGGPTVAIAVKGAYQCGAADDDEPT
jgi:hypothetical protein